MREIKFRAWNFKDKRVCSMNGYFNHSPYNDPKKYAWMQYTGLKDKNGVEIYEGDILLINDHFKKSVNMEIKKDILRGHGDYSIRFGIHIVSAFGDENDFEVIGNIYENTELLDE